MKRRDAFSTFYRAGTEAVTLHTAISVTGDQSIFMGHYEESIFFNKATKRNQPNERAVDLKWGWEGRAGPWACGWDSAEPREQLGFLLSSLQPVLSPSAVSFSLQAAMRPCQRSAVLVRARPAPQLCFKKDLWEDKQPLCRVAVIPGLLAASLGSSGSCWVQLL